MINRINNIDFLNKYLDIQKNNKNVLRKLVVSVSLSKMVKVQDYLTFQSICFLDTITAQKPTLRVSKFSYNLGNKTLTFTSKVTLRKRNLYYFIKYFETIVLSEMRRRYIVCEKYLNDINSFSFSFSNITVFTKLDEYYFRWNNSVVYNLVPNVTLNLTSKLNNLLF